ncbi:MAG: tRNA (guanosine(46)-N7)-methyltransferase TrmB, partial [Actinomyces graevenitzii]|nr:tRNA (guanosine(46)-N7)-methyltransferase TrmB [Actinomyces graevenitzii]
VSAKGLFDYPDAGARPQLGSDTWVEGDKGNGPDPGSPRGVMGGWSQRFSGRKLTRFEARGIAEGRTIRDLTALRTNQKLTPEIEPREVAQREVAQSEVAQPENGDSGLRAPSA